MKNLKQYFNKNLTIILIIVLALASFGFGWLVGQNSPRTNIASSTLLNRWLQPNNLAQDVDFDIFWQAWKIIQDEYVNQPVDNQQLFYGALAGLVAGLQDPYSLFFEPETTEEFTEELSGSFEGIGAEVAMRDGRFTIVTPLAESPAEKAGLLAGDQVYFIDGASTDDLTVQEAIKLVRGPRGTTVTLSVAREGLVELKDIVVQRDSINVPSVKFEMKDGQIAYIKIFDFNENSWILLNKIVKEVLAANPQGIILDLRNNPGGFLDVSIKVAGEWLTDEIAVIEKFGQDDEGDGYQADGQGRFRGIKTVVLVNEGSASGSEIVAGALQDHGLATIVGQITFGKGSVQNLIELPDGSSIKLTVARWFTPNGNSIDEVGIKPDIEVERTFEDYEAGLDPQLDKALELLSQ